MLVRSRYLLLIAGAFCVIGGLWAQLPFREYNGAEYDMGQVPKPPNWREPAEWVFSRLMYPQSRYGRAFGFRGLWDWHNGGSSWTIDYPQADRHVIEMVGRLTRLSVRGVEQPVNLEDGDDAYNWPWMYVVEPGTWDLTDEQVKKLRDYLLRGGFLMTDDFHGTNEWAVFMESLQRVFPDRQVIDIPPGDPIFHTLWDLNERFQVPGQQFLFSGRTYEQNGYDPKWRGLFDDKGRVMVAICHNMDLGDAVEHADLPEYPEKYSAQAMRTFINYIIYSMSH